MIIYLAALECESDRSKFEQLYMTYRQTMFYVANSILQDAAFSEDAVHQAFLRVIDHIQKISDVQCPQTKSFMVIIVRNIAINLYNARKKKAVLSLDELEEWTGEDCNTPADKVEADESFRKLVSLIKCLPEGYRSVLLLKYDNGYSTAEIALMLGLSEENVKKRLQRAKKKLKQMLGEVAIS